MNKEVVKAMQKKDNKSKIWIWWRKNNYKVLRVILFPVWFALLFNDWINKRVEWDETRANEILNYYIPRASKWDEEEKCFYFFDNGLGWNFSLAKQYLKRRDYRFWKKWRFRIQQFLRGKFELEGFIKKDNSYWHDETDITFYLDKEKAV